MSTAVHTAATSGGISMDYKDIMTTTLKITRFLCRHARDTHLAALRAAVDRTHCTAHGLSAAADDAFDYAHALHRRAAEAKAHADVFEAGACEEAERLGGVL